MLPMPAPSRQTGVSDGPLYFLSARRIPRLRARVTFGRSGPLHRLSLCLRRPHFFQQRKKWGKRTPPKTNGFWNSFRPITATPQKGPRRIAPAPIPAAASTCRGKMPYPTAVEQCTSAWYVGAAAIRGLHAIRCTTMFGNLSRAWYAAAVSAHPSRAGSLETCGFKQRFWSLLGLRPKVTHARKCGVLPSKKRMSGPSRTTPIPAKSISPSKKRNPAPLGAGSL